MNNEPINSNVFLRIVHFLAGVMVWVALWFWFLASFWAMLFAEQTRYLLWVISSRSVFVPFWLSLLATLFIFPVTVFVVLLGGAVNILREDA